jgi:hypothetical protein
MILCVTILVGASSCQFDLDLLGFGYSGEISRYKDQWRIVYLFTNLFLNNTTF